MEGYALDLFDPTKSVAGGVCVTAMDPTGAITGGDLEALGSGNVESDGSWSVDGVETSSALGILLLVSDAEGAEATVMPTATGIPASSYSSLGEGDVLDDLVAWSVDLAMAMALESGLASAGYTGDLAADGALAGFVRDHEGDPVDGALVEGPAGYDVWYYDGSGFVTTGTVATGGAFYIIPEAPIYSYSCSASGYSFETVLSGSFPEILVVTDFEAD